MPEIFFCPFFELRFVMEKQLPRVYVKAFVEKAAH